MLKCVFWRGSVSIIIYLPHHQGRDAAHLSSMLQRSQVLTGSSTHDQLLPLHAQQHAGQLPRARCRTRSRARPCEHRKGASVSHVAHEQLPQWQSLSSSWTPFRRLPFRLQRSEYSCESHEILATAGAPDAARVTVPARQVAARTRPWRGLSCPPCASAATAALRARSRSRA